MSENKCQNIIQNAMSDVIEAVSYDKDNLRIRFSYVAEAAIYVSTGRMKLYGCKGTKDSLEKIEKEFPELYKAIVHIRSHKSKAKEIDPVCAGFEKLISALRDIIDSEYMFLPTKDMVEKRPEFAINNEVFEDLQKNMERSCKKNETEAIVVPECEILQKDEYENASRKISNFVKNLKNSSTELWAVMPAVA